MNGLQPNSTGILRADLDRCDDLEQLKQRLLPLLRSQREAWQEKLRDILAESGLSCARLARLCKVSEPTVRKWLKGSVPQSRDMYIRIGFAAGYGLEQMNAFLMRYGRCPQLYVKSLEDSVCMFVLRSETLERKYETYLQLLELVKSELRGTADHQHRPYSTGQLNDYFAPLRSQEEMVEFACTHAPSYRQAYARLYSYIIAYLQINLQSEHAEAGDGRMPSFHAMANQSRWSSSLRHCISEIRNKRWFPLRHKVISLGLHLNMDTDAIDRMLQYAQMEPLYAGNPLEASVLWAVGEAQLCSVEDAIIPDGSSELCQYVKSVLLQLELEEEARCLIDDL